MGEQLIDLDSDINLARVLEICRYFDRRKSWERLFAMNRYRHPAGGAFVPYRFYHSDGVCYRLKDVLGFVARNVPDMTPERAQEMLKRFEGAGDPELDELLQMNEEDIFDFHEGCILDEDDFHDALGAISGVEVGIKCLKDHLVALTKLCKELAEAHVNPDDPIAEHLSCLGSTAINDADTLLFELQRLAALLNRKWEGDENELVELGERIAKEVA